MSKFLAFVLVVAACVGAAGTGAYLALRHNAAQATVAAANPDGGTPASVEAAPPAGTVNETEATVTPAPAEPAVEPAPAPEPVASKVAPAPPAPKPAPRAQESRSRRPEATRTPASTPVARAQRDAQGAPAVPRETPAPVVEAPPPVVQPHTPQPEPAPMPEPPREPERQFEERVVPSDSVIGLQIENNVSSETARVEDRVDARVTRDVRVAGQVAIPAGSRIQGAVTTVERGGKIRERARLGVRFHTLVLADGTRVPMQTETLFREGESPSGESAAKIGGAAVGGAIIGAILGGAKGAAIGGAAGAGGGTAAVMAGTRNSAELKAGQSVTVRLRSPVSVTVEKDHD